MKKRPGCKWLCGKSFSENKISPNIINTNAWKNAFNLSVININCKKSICPKYKLLSFYISFALTLITQSTLHKTGLLTKMPITNVYYTLLHSSII